jgi:hypothetical protein
MYARLQVGKKYTLDDILKKLERPTPISYGDYMVVVDLKDGIYYVTQVVSKSFIAYPVFYKILKAGEWDKAVQLLILGNTD